MGIPAMAESVRLANTQPVLANEELITYFNPCHLIK